MENGVSSVEDARLVMADDSQKQSNGLALLLPEEERGAMASVEEGILQNASEVLTEDGKNFHNPAEVTLQDPQLLPLEETSKSLVEIEDDINEKEAGQEEKRKGASIRKQSSTQTNYGKTDAKASQAPLKKKGEWMAKWGVVSAGEVLETNHGSLKVRIPNAKKKATKEKSTSTEKGAETPKALNPPNSARQSRGMRSSHSQFTVPQPFALATDRRASMGSHSLETHPLIKSKSFQAGRREETKATDEERASVKNDETLSSEKAKATQSHIFSFSSDVRAEQRKEFDSKVEERLTAKEVASKQAQAKTKEEAQAQIKEFRKSLSFKATPLPTFYQDSTPPKLEIKKIPPTRPKSPRLGRKSNTVLPSCDSKLVGAPACYVETHQANRAEGDTHCQLSVPKIQDTRKSTIADAKSEESKRVPKQELTEEPSVTFQKGFTVNEDVKKSTINEGLSSALAEGDELKHEEAEVDQVVGSDTEAPAMVALVGGLVDAKTSPPVLPPGPLVDACMGEQHVDAPSQPKKKIESQALVDSSMGIKSKLSRNPSGKTMAGQHEAKEQGPKALKKKPANNLGGTPKNVHGSKPGGKHITTTTGATAAAINRGSTNQELRSVVTDVAMAS